MNNYKNNRKRWFNIFKVFFRPFIIKPKFIYLGEEFDKNALVLSNHSGPNAPLGLEFYLKKRFRLLGTYEMNGSLKMVYKYLSETYFHKKRHWPLVLSKLFCLIASPFAFIFYRGLRLIPTYPDARLKNTFKEVLEALNDGQNIIVFPEDSSDGYFDELTCYLPGFINLANYCYKSGYDLKIYVSYFNKKTKKYIFDKPIYYSELLKLNLSKEELCNKLCIRCNELGKMK